jgi:osmoprotectant transport system substrate-binding protein
VEYTGTALTAILKEPLESDPGTVYDKVKRQYASRFGLEVMDPLGFNKTFAIVIRGETARRFGLHTLSEAAPHAADWRPGFGYEFMERPDGYPGLAAAYGLHFAAPPRIMDLGLLAPALKAHQIDIAAGNATDGLIPALDLFVLEDDLHYFPPYEAVAVIRQQTVQQHPEVGEALALLGGQITDQEMQKLNYALDGQHRDVKDVAREFLQSKGLIH